jgi:hypothetical protein
MEKGEKKTEEQRSGINTMPISPGIDIPQKTVV